MAEERTLKNSLKHLAVAMGAAESESEVVGETNIEVVDFIARNVSKSSKLTQIEYRRVTEEFGTYSFDVPDYDHNDIDVYINGLRCVEGVDYTISATGTITTVNTLDVGTELIFVVNKIEKDDTNE